MWHIYKHDFYQKSMHHGHTRFVLVTTPHLTDQLGRLPGNSPKHDEFSAVHTYIHTYTYSFTDPSSAQVRLNVEFVIVHPYFGAPSGLHNRKSSSVSTLSHSIPRSQLGRLCTP